MLKRSALAEDFEMGGSLLVVCEGPGDAPQPSTASLNPCLPETALAQRKEAFSWFTAKASTATRTMMQLKDSDVSFGIFGIHITGYLYSRCGESKSKQQTHASGSVY